MDYEFHPLANLFPLIAEGSAEFSELVADIKAHGLREAITLHEGQILDGRNRYRAAKVAGIELDGDCDFEDFLPKLNGDPMAWVISKNLHRRHLTTEQRKEIAAKLLAADPTRTDRGVAKEVGLSPTTVAGVRAEGEARVRIGHVPTTDRVDANGRKSARKTPTEPKVEVVRRDPISYAAKAQHDTVTMPDEQTRKAEELRQVYTGVRPEVGRVQDGYLGLAEQEQTYFRRWLKSQLKPTPPEPALIETLRTWVDTMTSTALLDQMAALIEARRAELVQAASAPEPEVTAQPGPTEVEPEAAPKKPNGASKKLTEEQVAEIKAQWEASDKSDAVIKSIRLEHKFRYINEVKELLGVPVEAPQAGLGQ